MRSPICDASYRATRRLEGLDATAWGQALFQHYFVGHDARPVSLGSRSAQRNSRRRPAPLTVRPPRHETPFLGQSGARLRPSAATSPLPSLERRALESARAAPVPRLPLLHMLRSVLLDADMADEGVFRERVRQLLGHDEGTSYALGDLSRLWEAFATWLQSRHDAGEPYRTLSLPDRGRMTLIGYSVRLAFPRREDRLKLRAVLAALGAGPAPTVPEAFQAIARTRERFSTDFRHVFYCARTALASGRDVPELLALWSAIIEAASLATWPDSRSARIRYQLLAQENGGASNRSSSWLVFHRALAWCAVLTARRAVRRI